MTTESLPREMDAHIVNLLTRLSNIRENNPDLSERRIPMSTEARSLELWRAVAVECLATFLFGLVVSGAASSTAVSGSGLSILATAIASGFAVSAIYLIFGHVSGETIFLFPSIKILIFNCRLLYLFFNFNSIESIKNMKFSSEISRKKKRKKKDTLAKVNIPFFLFLFQNEHLVSQMVSLPLVLEALVVGPRSPSRLAR